jgi:sirohydrochlorin ferrochelatase
MTAVILLAHGSPDPRSSEATRELASTLQSRSFDSTVLAAFLEHDAPNLTEAVRKLVGDGHDEIVVVPAFLSGASHVSKDVPAAVEAAETATQLPLTVSDPIGPDGTLLSALDRLLPPGPAVLATAGSTDPRARRALGRIATTWAAQRQAPVIVAYASQAEPDVATALRMLEEETGERAGVASFVLFPGVLPDRIAAAADGRPLSAPLYSALETVTLIESRVASARRRVA